MSISPSACSSCSRLVAGGSNKVGSHIAQGVSGWWWWCGGRGRKIDATLLWCDLERSPNLRYDLNLTDFQQTCGFNHPPGAPCVLRVPPRSVSMRGPSGVDTGGPSAANNEAEVSAGKLKQCHCKETPQLPTDRLLCAAAVSRINLQQAVKQTGRYPSQTDCRTETHL